MVRIVQVNRSEAVESEFILLQNQGGLRVCLRGLAVISERAISEGDLSLAHAFIDETQIPPGAFVLVHTGAGEPRLTRCKDGLVYHVYMGRESSLWEYCPGPVHVLGTQHTYVERSRPALLV